MPAIFNNITVPLLGLSDTAISGHLGDDVYLAAMAVGSTMFYVIFMLCGFLRMGTTGLAAHANGANDAKAGRDILKKATLIALVISALVLLANRQIERLLLYLIAPAPNIAAEAAKYFGIVVWSVPAQLCVMAMSGWFIGRKNTLIPMMVSVGINVINIALSISLVFKFDFGFKGVALGTLVANWLGLIAMAACLRKELRRDLPGTVEMKTNSENEPAQGTGKVKWSTFFNVNGNLFFRSACIMGVSLSMTAVGAGISETALAANSVMLQFFLFFSYFMDGFAFAGEALVGNAVGAHDGTLLRNAVKALVRWGCVLAIVFALIYAVAGKPIVGLLSDSEAVLAEVARMQGWLVVLPAATVWAFIFDGVFIGLARTRPLLIVTLIGASLFFIIIALGKTSFSVDRNRVLWSAFEVYLLARGVLLGLRYLKLQRKSLIL